MKRIGFLTNYGSPDNKVRRALDELAHTSEFHVETIDNFGQIESIAQTIWGLINLVDVVVAYVTKESPNLYYEIGLAHGAGKPVIIVAEDLESLPPDLKGQRIILVDSDKYPLENLRFR